MPVGSAAVKVTERFRKAAQQAVPKLAREGGIFRNMDLEYVGGMQGLVSDMMGSDASRDRLWRGARFGGGRIGTNEGVLGRRPAKWYESWLLGLWC
jgi:hypothetical protein